MNILDKFLNRVNMYRLAIYYLASLVLAAAILSVFKLLPYSSVDIISGAVFLLAASYIFNLVFARLVGAKSNTESVFISALILSLIVGPAPVGENIILLLVLAAAAMGSKYLLAHKRKHIFNPAAAAVFFTAIVMGEGASWWVGDIYLIPLVILGGILIMKKISRWSAVAPFLIVYLALMSVGGSPWPILLYSPILFFVFIMLPEPQTSPKRRWPKVAYGIFTGVVLALYQTYWPVPYTLEAALLTGNLFAFALYPAVRVKMILRESRGIGPGLRAFWFRPDRKLDFIPGQFLEWTVIHRKPDSRGIRRYFTIASSPTENEILLAARLPDEPSTFKKHLAQIQPGEEVAATGPEGDFVLPASSITPSNSPLYKGEKKFVFIAGGIGITPYRSMIKFLLDKNIKRDIVVIYAANSEKEFVFEDIFRQAEEKFGLKVFYTTELVDEEMIARDVPDYRERIFYVSGPQPMVRAAEKILSGMMVKAGNIKHDYFPGYEEI